MSIIKSLHRLQWRIRFTFIAFYKTRWGFAMWWDWSDTNYREFSDDSTPHNAVMEEIYAMAAEQ